MVSRNRIIFVGIVSFMILISPGVGHSNPSVPNLVVQNFQPSFLTVQTLLPDPDMDTSPNVVIAGTTNEFSSSHLQSTSNDRYISLQWSHTAGTPLNWVDNWDIDGDIPASYDFIYFTQDFDWDIEKLPSDAYLNLSLRVEKTGDFISADGESMFSIHVWLIDTSENWNEIYRSQPPYNDAISVIEVDFGYFDIEPAWGGMVEDPSGIQTDPTDVLTFAIGLAPNATFQSYNETLPWNEYDGTVTVDIYNANLYALTNLEPGPDEVLNPLANNTWGSKIQDALPDVTDENEDVYDWCKTIATDADSFVYVLANSIIYSEKNEDTGDYFRYPTILKFDSAMNLVWTRKYHDWTFGNSICVKNGFIYVVGADKSGETEDLFLTKWDSFGNIVWDVKWDTGVIERGGAVGVADDGTVYVLSEVDPELGAWLNITGALLKYNVNGILEWNTTIDYPVSSYFYCNLEIVSDGILTSDGLFCTFWNFLGVKQWSSFHRSITADSDGNLFTSELYWTEGRGGRGLQFNKMFSNGTIQWSTNFTISYSGIWEALLRWPSMSIAPDGSLLAYTVEQVGFIQNHILVKFSADGEYQWHKEIQHDVSLPFGGSVAYMSVAPNGLAYFTITKSEDITVYSYDIGVSVFYIPPGLLFLLAASFGVVGISIIIMKRIRVVDYFRKIKNR